MRIIIRHMSKKKALENQLIIYIYIRKYNSSDEFLLMVSFLCGHLMLADAPDCIGSI